MLLQHHSSLLSSLSIKFDIFEAICLPQPCCHQIQYHRHSNHPPLKSNWSQYAFSLSWSEIIKHIDLKTLSKSHCPGCVYALVLKMHPWNLWQKIYNNKNYKSTWEPVSSHHHGCSQPLNARMGTEEWAAGVQMGVPKALCSRVAYATSSKNCIHFKVSLLREGTSTLLLLSLPPCLLIKFIN